MLRLRLDVPLHFFLNASDPNLLTPSLDFEHESLKVRVTVSGGPPLHVDQGDEREFRTISRCRIEIKDESPAEDLLKAVEAKRHQELVDVLLPVVNRTLLAIRNFGRVTTAR